MFDFGFSEILLVGVIALIILGPERLPKVARWAGQMLGKIRNFVSSVKTDISSQVDFQEWQDLSNNLRRDMEDSIHSLEQKVSELRSNLEDTIDRHPENYMSEDFAEKTEQFYQHKRAALQKQRRQRLSMKNQKRSAFRHRR